MIDGNMQKMLDFIPLLIYYSGPNQRGMKALVRTVSYLLIFKNHEELQELVQGFMEDLNHKERSQTFEEYKLNAYVDDKLQAYDLF